MKLFFKPTVTLTLLFLFSFQFLLAQQKAFPSAYGAGAYVTGGRGGVVVHVTNLNSSGQGSLRAALQMTVPRTIVFDVSGVINLTSLLYMDSSNSNVTIAGQTAPEGGITIDGGKWYIFNVDNMIVRHIRVKGGIDADLIPNSNDGLGSSSMSVVGDITNQIWDHVSFAFGNDETAEWYSEGATDMANVTIQKCFFAEGFKGGIFGKESGNSGIYGDISYINNLFYNAGYRFPNIAGDNMNIDLINNVAWTTKGRLTRGNGSYKLNHIGNYYNYGSYPIYDKTINLHSEGTIPQIYSNGNKIIAPNVNTGQGGLSSSVAEMNADNTQMWKFFVGNNYGVQLPTNYFTSVQRPLNGEPFNIVDAETALINAIADSGCNARLNSDGNVSDNLDVLDTQWLGVIAAGNFVAKLPESAYNVPHINSVTRPGNFYVNNPHIPEDWFSANVPAGQDHNDIAPSGYTWLEEYLNRVDGENVSIAVESVEVTPSAIDLTVPETTTLTATISPENATNKNGVWSSSDESIATVDANGVVTSISPGTVTITFTTNDGGYTSTSQITVFPEALQASAGSDQQICLGESTTLTASGGTSYIWNNGETTASIEVTPNDTTTYTVTVSDDHGQSVDASVTVTVNPLPVANAGEDQTICQGELATLNATGGDSYIWSTGETTASIEVNPTIETIFSVEVISNNCSSTDDITIFVNDAPDITVTEDVLIVEGNSTTLTANGGDTYEWNTGETTDTINVSPAVTTTYTVSSIGVNGCTGSAEVTVTVIPEIIADAGEDVTICNGDSTTLSASGGLTYTWDNGDTGADIIVSPTETTTYTVTAEDAYGYTDTDTVTVIVNDIPEVTIVADLFVMIGNSANITASGGIAYLWNTGETTATISVTPAVTTTYTVTAFSVNGCETSVDVLITVVEELNADAGEDVSICLGESIALNASGGITYNWNTGEVGAYPIVSPTETTTYTVTVTDGFGNSDSDDVTITVNPVPTALASEDQTICNGESVTLTAEGGDSYLWSTGETTSTITVNPNTDTTYTVEVTTNGCSDSDDVVVTVLPTPDIIISDDIVIMTGSSTILEVSGGDTYLWNSGETTNSINVSPTDTTTYSVTAFLNNGCQSITEVTVTVVPEVTADAGNDVSICSGDSVTLNASGGVTYIWNTGGTGASPTVSPTETTTYTVTVTDDYGNSDSDSVTVTVNELPNLTVSDDITIDEGGSTTLIANGADSYLWNTGETSSTINVSPSETTTYIITGFSVEGCQSETEVVVTVIPELVANAGNDVTICSGESVTLNASGGLTYTWNTGDTGASPTFTPTATTTYTVTVTDSYGNSDSDSVTVTVNELPNVSVSDSITIIEGETTNLIVSGADTYLWSTGENTSTISVSPTQTTTYTVTGTTNSCSVEVEVTVIVEELFVASAGEDESVCDNETYEIVLTANQGDSYLWNTGATTQSIVVSPLSTSTYSVTVTQGEQADTDDVTVYVEPSPEVVIENGDSVEILNGDFITLSASGANTYEWNNGATQPNIAVSPSVTTTYEVKGYIGDCYDEKQVTVNVLQPVVANAGDDVFICLDELATLTASGGDEYVWSTGETTPTIQVSPTETTEYTVTVFNALDFDEATVTVEVNLNCEEEAIVPIDDDSIFSFDIFPNPANDVVNVKLSGGALIVSHVHIYDLTGKLIKSIQIANEDLNPSTTRQIDISSLQNGIYFVKLIDMDKEVTKKLIVN